MAKLYYALEYILDRATVIYTKSKTIIMSDLEITCNEYFSSPMLNTIVLENIKVDVYATDEGYICFAVPNNENEEEE